MLFSTVVGFENNLGIRVISMIISFRGQSWFKKLRVQKDILVEIF